MLQSIASDNAYLNSEVCLRDFTLSKIDDRLDQWVASRVNDQVLINTLPSHVGLSMERLTITQKNRESLVVVFDNKKITIFLTNVIPHCKASALLLMLDKAECRFTQRIGKVSETLPDWLMSSNYLPVPNKPQLTCIRRIIRKLEGVSFCSFESIKLCAIITPGWSKFTEKEQNIILRMSYDHLLGFFPVPMHGVEYSKNEWHQLQDWCSESAEAIKARSHAYQKTLYLENQLGSLYDRLFIDSYKSRDKENSCCQSPLASVKKCLTVHAYHFRPPFLTEPNRSIESLRVIQLEIRRSIMRCNQRDDLLLSTSIFSRSISPQEFLDTYKNTIIEHDIMPILHHVYGIDFSIPYTSYSLYKAPDVLHRRVSIDTFIRRKHEVINLISKDQDLRIRNRSTELSIMADAFDLIKSHHIPSVNRKIKSLIGGGYSLGLSYRNRSANAQSILYSAIIECPSRKYTSPTFVDSDLLLLIAKNYIASIADLLSDLCLSAKNTLLTEEHYYEVEMKVDLKIRKLIESL